MDPAELIPLQERTRAGLRKVRQLRKYQPRGAFTPTEIAALDALLEVDHALGRLLAATQQEVSCVASVAPGGG